MNGLATLDSGGKVPTSQLPDTILGQLEYISGWNASTNSPTIPAASSGNKGEFYIVTTAVNAGHGHANVPNVAFDVGDWLLSNGTSWEKILNSAAVTSVAGRIGAVVLTSADMTDRTALGAQWFTMATPAGVRFARINSDGTVTLRTAAELRTDLGATDLGTAYLTMATPAGTRFARINSDGTVTLRTAAELITDLGLGTAASQNEVTVSDTSGQSTASTSYVDMTGISVSLAANKTYRVTLYVLAECSNTSGGINISLNGSAAASYVGLQYAGVQASGNLAINSGNSYDNTTNQPTGVPAANTVYLTKLEAVIVNGASASTLTGRVRRGGTTGSVTIRAAVMKVTG